MPHISVVIPVYEAEDCLHELYRRLKETIETITQDFEIIMVEDCSTDHSWNIIAELSAADRRVRGIRFSRNFGQHYGITAGLDYCCGDWVVIMDCDLQDPPEEIPHLYKKALEGYDVVLALRTERKVGILKHVTSYLFYKVFSYLADTRYDSRIGNFRIISRKVVKYFRMMRERLRFFGGMIDWMGFSAASIVYKPCENRRRKSSYTFKKLFNLAFDAIIAFSDKPLRLAVKIGFVISLFAFVYGIYVIFKAIFFKIPVPGWSSLFISLYFLSGIIIIFLGILGIYLEKIFNETKKRPLYIISKRTDES